MRDTAYYIYSTKNAKRLIAGLMAMAILASPVSLFAAQSTFTTSLTTFGTDTTPPTVPANLVATPVSTSEIDLTWSASSDNVGVTGYRIFRGGSFLATTTALSYADTGLLASTTYSYTVEAFDHALNFSGQSAPVSTSTFQVVVNPTPAPTPTPTTGPTTGSSGGSTSILIYNVTTEPGTDQAIVKFETNIPTQAKLSWGLSTDYEMGSLMSPVYGTSHELLISGLDRQTVYDLRIDATDANGRTAFVGTTFETLRPVSQPLPNPSFFTATGYNDHVDLNWQNPSDPRVTGVRIVRSDTYFPKDPYDGIEVYEGAGSGATDHDVAADHEYYYAAFAYDGNGAFSSGAIASVKTPAAASAVFVSGDPFADLPQSTLVDPAIAALSFYDFEYLQNDRLLTPVNGNVVAIDGTQNVTIRLAYGKVPEILKTIAVTLSDPKDQSKVFPFLLRVNADRTYYEATIGPLGRTGTYAMHIIVLDYQNQGLKRIQGSLQALVIGSFSGIPSARADFSGLFLLFLLILVVILFLILIDRRRKQGTGKGQAPADLPIYMPTA